MTITLKDYIYSLDQNWTLEDWLSWPPDIFALTSLILKQTGAYICTVLPPGEERWPKDYDWKVTLQQSRTAWYSWILGEQQWIPEFLSDHVQSLEANWEHVTLDDLQELISPEGSKTAHKKEAWDICRCILELHSLADEMCAGFGTPSGNNWTRDADQKAIRCIANLLLAHTGSLSRLATHIVRVLPKLRTPAVGMTLRSLSHHLTIHQTEVDIIWRTMPWVNIDENTINILIVPWPYETQPTWFRPSAHSTQRNSTERTRYFDYTGCPSDFPAHNLLSLIKDAEDSVNRVHLVVFPELALTRENLDELLDVLASEKRRDQLPMVLAGVRSATENSLGANSVILSTFFAGKWYQMEQDKHHRWKLDEKQIQQYNLGGVLTGSKEWWEAIKISNRRLSVLAPNNWLTLCPLICEDLARLEPVSEIVRGIGPTLLIAILLDGPQLKDRWPGRYASVMADDPGSSVLTVSSLGLAQRSLPLLPVPGENGSKHVALWKDHVTGWKEIRVDDPRGGVVLTIAAHWREEFTADGRGDENNAAVFVFQGIHQVKIKEDWELKGGNLVEKDFRVSKRHDFLEITLFSYFVDALLDTRESLVEDIRNWVLGEDGNFGMHQLRPRLSLFERIKFEVDKENLYDKSREDFKPFVQWFCDLIQKIKRNTDDGKNAYLLDFEYYGQVVDYAKQILERVMEASFLDNLEKGDPFAELRKKIALPKDLPPKKPVHRKVRVCIYGCLAMLWAVHARLNGLRRKGQLNKEGAELLSDIEGMLKIDYDQKWYEAMDKFAA